MNTSPDINELATAMAKAQSLLKPAVKDAVNPAYRSKYADLTGVWEACREALTQCGLAVWQDVVNTHRLHVCAECGKNFVDAGGISVLTRIAHSSGQWVEFGPLTVPLAKQDAHGVGSATSYAKRY